MVTAKKLSKFDPKTFLSTIDGGRKMASFRKKQTIFVQGDLSDTVFYIQKGTVRLTVVSLSGKEATIGILDEGDFFGEGCLAGQTLRLFSVTAMTDCLVMRVDKKSMIEVLHREHAFSDMFVAYLRKAESTRAQSAAFAARFATFRGFSSAFANGSQEWSVFDQLLESPTARMQ